jgi:hypothetical protein
MGQGDSDAEKDRAADDRPEDFVAESVHVALHQSHDRRIGDTSIACCAGAHAMGVLSISLPGPAPRRLLVPLGLSPYAQCRH